MSVGTDSVRRRTGAAALGTASTALTTLLVTLAVARESTVGEFGVFALMSLLLVLAQGVLNAAFGESSVVALGERAVVDRNIRRLMLSATAVGAALSAAAWWWSSYYLLILALTLPGLGLLDHLRNVNAAVLSPRRSLGLVLPWSASASVVAVASFVQPIPPEVVVACWLGVGATIGFGAAVLDRRKMVPGWPMGQPHEGRTSALFAADFLAGSGSAAITTILLGPVVGGTALAAVRGASTILGPVAMLATVARLLVLPLLARARGGQLSDVRVGLRVASLLALILVPCLVALTLLPPGIGTALLGATFEAARPLLPALALESLFGVIGAVAAAGHRSRRAGGRSLTIRVTLALPRIVLVLGAATIFGLLAAVWTMAGLSVLNAFVWWTSWVTHRDVPEEERRERAP